MLNVSVPILANNIKSGTVLSVDMSGMRSCETKEGEMSKGHYLNWSSDEAYEKGKRDQEYGRRDYDYDRYSDREGDKAYFDGQKDAKRDEERRREERYQEEQTLEIEQRKHKEELYLQQEEEFWEQHEQEREQKYVVSSEGEK
jgi:hypothetical protein